MAKYKRLIGDDVLKAGDQVCFDKKPRRWGPISDLCIGKTVNYYNYPDDPANQYFRGHAFRRVNVYQNESYA